MSKTLQELIFLRRADVAEHCPDRWFIPSAALLEAIEPGQTQAKLLVGELDEAGYTDVWEAFSVWLAVESCESDRLVGEIVLTGLPDRDGYRVGDRLTVHRDHVFDVQLLDPDGMHRLNVERAFFILGKRVLCAETELSHDGQLIGRRQFIGTIAGVERRRGIRLSLDDETVHWIPPDARILQEARPGDYRLVSTGELVLDPDYIFTYKLRRPEPK